jgi:uncharacterized protein
MDDANIPSVLSLPYLGYCQPNNTLYVQTRKFLLSSANPYYFAGSYVVHGMPTNNERQSLDADVLFCHESSAGEGIGGPHVGINYIWPMSIMIRALTSTDDKEIELCLEMLKHSTAGTGVMHESFYKSDAGDYTRPWFAWANSLFGELILTLAAQRPHLIFGTTSSGE